MGNIIAFKRQSCTSKISVQLEHIFLEDGSFWYRVGWEDYKGCVHMLKSEVVIAEEVTGWRALQMKQYHPDFLDEIFMQRTEDAYHYGKRKE